MKNFPYFIVLVALFAPGCATTKEVLPPEIFVHTESQFSNAFLPWIPANERSLEGSYSGEMGDTAESAEINVIEGGKKLMIEGHFVTRTVESAPSRTPIEPTRLEKETYSYFRVPGGKVYFVTYMDPLQTVFKRPVDGLVHKGLFYVKDSELE